MKNIILLLCLALTSASSETNIYQCKDGKVKLTGDAPLEKIVAKSSSLEGLLSIKSKRFNFRQNLNNFNFSQGAKQKRHAEEKYWETDKYPYAQYKGKIIDENLDLTEKGTYKVETKGTFSIHGVSKEIKVPGSIKVKKNQIIIDATFKVKLPEYNITVPEMMFMKVSKVFKVEVNTKLTPKNDG